MGFALRSDLLKFLRGAEVEVPGAGRQVAAGFRRLQQSRGVTSAKGPEERGATLSLPGPEIPGPCAYYGTRGLQAHDGTADLLQF